MDLTTSCLRVLLAVAERGSFTAAAAVCGYTQSGVSRQVAAAEQELGVRLFDRGPAGVRPSAAGRVLLREAAVALEALDAAERVIRSGAPAIRAPRTRLGHVPTAGAWLVPAAVAHLGDVAPNLVVSTREGTTPTSVRSVRTGTLDLAVVTSRPPHRAPDDASPSLVVVPLIDVLLAVAVPTEGALAEEVRAASSGDGLPAEHLARLPWVASPGRHGEPLLGVWPGLPGRPGARFVATDWTTKLAFVASGLAVTTVPARLHGALPDGIAVLGVTGVVAEVRRFSAVHLAERTSDVATVVGALERVAADLD